MPENMFTENKRNLDLNFNTLRPRLNGQHFENDIFKSIFFNENAAIMIRISLKFLPEGLAYNKPASSHVMAWRRTDDKPLFEPVMVR